MVLSDFHVNLDFFLLSPFLIYFLFVYLFFRSNRSIVCVLLMIF